MPTYTRDGRPILNRLEARNALGAIRSRLLNVRADHMHTARAWGIPPEKAIQQTQIIQLEVELAALDTCEAALETLGD